MSVNSRMYTGHALGASLREEPICPGLGCESARGPSRIDPPGASRVVACWDRSGLVAHVEHSRRGEDLELSWPRQGVLVRGTMSRGAAADLLAGHLVADELAHR